MMRISKLIGAAAIAATALVPFAAANAATPPHATLATTPQSAPSFQLAGYRHRYDRRAPYLYSEEGYPGRYYAPRHYGGGYYYSDEIRELRRLYPQTNWPPSLRY